MSSHVEFVHETQDEILGSACRRDDAVGEGFLKFCCCCSSFLRSREVFLQSRGAADRNCAADPDELPGFCIEYFFVLEIEDLLADFHGLLLVADAKKATTRLP
jgi:hypothetical protein